MRGVGRTAFATAVTFLCGMLQAGQVARQHTFTIREHLGQAWSNELVVFPLPASLASSPLAVHDSDGHSRPFQIIREGSINKIAFLANLSADSDATWHVTARPEHSVPAPETIRVETTNELIRVWNGHTGIAVRRKLRGDDGPIAGVRMASGRWIGDSHVNLRQTPVAYEARVLSHGPVFVEVLTTLRFPAGQLWTMRLRVIDGEPAVVIDEQFDLNDGSTWELDLRPGLNPNRGLFRTAWHRPSIWPTHALHVRSLDDETTPFVLRPWITWSDGRQVSCLQLFADDDRATYPRDAEERRLTRVAPDQADVSKRDVLFIAAGQASRWAEPGQSGPGTGVPLRTSGDRRELIFPLRQPGRHWIIGGTTLQATLVPDRNLTVAEKAAVKHCDTSLQQVQEMTLVWGSPDASSQYPRLVYGAAESRRLAARLPAPEQRSPRQRRLYRDYLDQSDSAARRRINETFRSLPVAMFTENLRFHDGVNGQHIRQHDSRVWTHTTCRVRFVPLADDALGRSQLTRVEFERLRARLAFLAYKLASPDYYSPERGWSANPNMTTTRHAVVGLLGCLLADHPRARDWYELGSAEILRQLENWVGPNGGWLESPHYQSLLGDGVFLLSAAQRNGLGDDIRHPALLRTVQYLAKISTPRDPRFFNRRHLPAVGHTYRYETTGLFALLAAAHRNTNPQAAGHLQWAWQEHGRPMWTGIGGGSSIAEIMDFLVDEDVPAIDPRWTSESFPNSGTILRAHVGTPQESSMYVLHGRGNEHYDDDRGSFSLWGLGQPLCLDWGYSEPYTADMHNMLDTGRGPGRVAAFSTTGHADYLHVDCGPWQRQVLMISGAPPADGPLWFVSDATSVPGYWHQWFHTERPLGIHDNAIHMHGPSDVDLLVWLAGERADELTRDSSNAELLVTENRTQVCAESTREGSTRRGELSQRGVRLRTGPNNGVAAVYYPMKRGRPRPGLADLADGRGVRVTSSGGIDYVFLASRPFRYSDGSVQFRGTAGAIRIRDQEVTLTLSAAGSIQWGQHRLSSDQPRSQVLKRVREP